MDNAREITARHSNDDFVTIQRETRVLYRAVLVVLAVLSIAPLIALKIYIRMTDDVGARWIAIEYMPLQLTIWAFFAIAAVVGIARLISGKGGAPEKQSSEPTHISVHTQGTPHRGCRLQDRNRSA